MELKKTKVMCYYGIPKEQKDNTLIKKTVFKPIASLKIRTILRLALLIIFDKANAVITTITYYTIDSNFYLTVRYNYFLRTRKRLTQSVNQTSTNAIMIEQSIHSKVPHKIPIDTRRE